MKKKTVIWPLAIVLLSIACTVDAVSVRTLRWKVWNNDVSQSATQIDWSRSLFDIISVVNSYLRFAIGFVCFLFMIWNGYQLIMARGDSKQMKSATNALVWCGVGLVVCLLAYIIVNLAIKLFA